MKKTGGNRRTAPSQTLEIDNAKKALFTLIYFCLRYKKKRKISKEKRPGVFGPGQREMEFSSNERGEFQK